MNARDGDSDNNQVNFQNPSEASSSSDAPGTIVTPTEADCIFGRGSAVSQHPGNLRLHSFVVTYHENYESATSRTEKVNLIELIYNSMRLYGRFVRVEQSSGTCFVASHAEAKEKIRQAMRYYLQNKNKGRAAAKKKNAGSQPNLRAQIPQTNDRHNYSHLMRRDEIHLFADEELENLLGDPMWYSDLPDLSAVAFLFLLEDL